MQMSKWEPPEDDEQEGKPAKPPVTEKQCNKCGKVKPIEEFYSRGKDAKYKAAYCKDCHTKPFLYERIVCPHCNGRICFFGLDENGNIQKQKSEILDKLKKEAKQEIKLKKSKKKIDSIPENKNIKGIF